MANNVMLTDFAEPVKPERDEKSLLQLPACASRLVFERLVSQPATLFHLYIRVRFLKC